MLRVYAVMIDVLRQLRPVLVQIERHDRDLGNQLRRASASVALNVAEASGSSGTSQSFRMCGEDAEKRAAARQESSSPRHHDLLPGCGHRPDAR